MIKILTDSIIFNRFGGMYMYTSTAYWHQSRMDFKDKKHPLFIGSCGTYRLDDINEKIPTHRPRGRLDYQFIYVASGKAHFYFQGKEEIVSAGNIVLYRPKEEQRYYYYGQDKTEVYWVHFTGNNVKNILRKYSITDDMHTIYTSTSLEYKHLFHLMIQELQLCRTNYEELLVHYFMELLIMIQRLIEVKPKKRKVQFMQKMDDAVHYFQEHYNEPISIEQYAESQNVSVSWFINNFKSYTHITPAQYILNLRIMNAKTLLETTEYNISEISRIIGYENALYFSRIFRKQCGMSPSQFRKQLQEHENT